MRFRVRPRSIRARTLLLVLTPLVSLVGLYIYTATAAAENSIALARATAVRNSIADPAGLFAGQVEQERLAAATFLARPSQQGEAALAAQEKKTDATLSTMRTAVASAEGDEGPSIRSAISALLREAAGIPGLRSKVSSKSLSAAASEQAYTAVTTAAYQAIGASFEQLPDVDLVSQSEAVLRVAEAEDQLLQAQTLFAADVTAGSFPAADRVRFATLTGGYQALFDEALSDLGPQYRAPFEAVAKSPEAGQLNALDAQVLNAPPSTIEAVAAQYAPVAQSVALGLAAAGFSAGQTLAVALDAAAGPITVRLVVTAGAGLAAIIVSIVLSLWIGRGIIRELAWLRREALDLAGRRLPRVMAMLSSGETVDIEAEAPALPSGADEIGQVRQAFNIVQRAAIGAAAEQATLRSGVATVFRNLAMRSQSLLHQQLQLLDTLEQRADGPEELDRLYQIDHLATRMRRNAEGLLVVAGEQPGRTWTEPVQMVDVLRGSVAEIADYARVQVICQSSAALKGHAVADAIHLIAELTENATAFSPARAKVRVSASEYVQGFGVEVEDKGIGIPAELAARLNATLADPPPFNPAESDHLGIYVAARLARRHGIRITLRVSPYGGTTAIVLFPTNIMVSDEPQVREQFPAATDPPSAAELQAIERQTAERQPAERRAINVTASAGDGPPAAVSGRHASSAGPAHGIFRGIRGRGAPKTAAPPRTAASVTRTTPAAARPGPPPPVPVAAPAAALPRRVRQANLPDHLRQGPPLAARQADRVVDPDLAEKISAAFADIQGGMERGNGESLDPWGPRGVGPVR
jgi:signal transduction histidine kinase